MAWGKKPWQGGSKKKKRHHSFFQDQIDYDDLAFDTTSQYRSKREAKHMYTGFLSMIVFVAILVGVMFGLILFFHWVGVTFR